MQPTTPGPRAVSKLVDNPPFVTDDKPAQVSDAFDGTLKPILANTLPDTIIRSSDRVYFAVHGRKVSYSSTRAFNGLLPLDGRRSPAQPTRLVLDERADVVNVLLHTAYGISADAYSPSFQVLCDTVDALRKYGLMPLPRYIYSGKPLFNTIVSQAEHNPLEAYAFAADENLESLAVAVSSKTLRLTVYDLPQSLADRMGTQYLGRLHRLHNERMDGMKILFNTNPPLHEVRPGCSKKIQQHIRDDFMLACGRLMWKAPNLGREDLESRLGAVVDSSSCIECKDILQREYDQVLRSWSQLKTTI